MFAQKNIGIFGYFAYFYLLILIYPIYRFYIMPKWTGRRIEIICGTIIGFLALLMLQAMILKIGWLGEFVLNALKPFIGYFGIFILILAMIFLSIMIFSPKSYAIFLQYFKFYSLKIFQKIKILINKIRQDIQLQSTKKINGDTKIFIPQPSITKKPSEGAQEYKKEQSSQIIFDENNVKIMTNPFIDKNAQAKKYGNMVRLVNDDEEVKITEVDIKRVLDRNKKIFEELNAKHFKDPVEKTSTPLSETKILSIKKSTEEFSSNKFKIDEDRKKIENPLIQNEYPKATKWTFPDLKSDKSQEYENKNISNSEKSMIEEIPIQEKKQISQEDSKHKKFYGNNQPSAFNQFSQTKTRSLIIKELSENTQLLKELDFGEPEKPKDYKLPNTDLLELPKLQNIQVDENEIDKKIQDLLAKLKMFKIDGDIARTYSGPIVTTFEFRPAPSVKVSRILTLGDDLAMALLAQSIRIQAPIPGKDVVGIEIPNAKTDIIYLREILESNLFKNSASPLTLALGKDIVGNPFITDLKKLPHLLIAGTTGSGKSVGVNAMILSLLFRNSPDNLKLIMIDPKMVEFSMYSDIPHLLTPIITDPKKAIAALGSVVAEMERRYKIMSETRTKNIDKYNPKAKLEGLEVFPFLVVIIDELADLMMTGGKEAEFPIARIAQMGRAAGLHLVVATQRPSVDVVTGLIKTNLPSRISFKVGSKIDSRVVLDTEGAQSLLGRGDMLFTPPGIGGVVRLHAPWASEEEIEEIVSFIKSQREVEYDKNFLLEESNLIPSTISLEGGGELIDEAKRIILQDRKTSISYLQRKLGVGYNKSASIIEELQDQGFLSPPNSKGVREVIG